jgi:hypothetical protein
MVNLLPQQIGTVFNPLIWDTNQSHQALTTQMGRIADFFVPPTCLPTSSTSLKLTTIAVDRTSGSEATGCNSTSTSRTHDSRST